MIEIKTKEDFNENVLASGLTILKIGTGCCGPCKVVEEMLKRLEATYSNVKFLVIDAEECDEEFLDSFGIRNIPVLIYYKDGKEIDRTVGMQTEEQVKTKIQNNE